MDPVPGAGSPEPQPEIFQVKIKEEDLNHEVPLPTIKQEPVPIPGAGSVPAASLCDVPLLAHLEENVFSRAAQITQNGYWVKPEAWGESEDLDGGDTEEEVSPPILGCQAEDRGEWDDCRGDSSIREACRGSRVRREWERASGSRDRGEGEWVSDLGDRVGSVRERQAREEGRMGQGQRNRAGGHRAMREREAEDQRREEEDPLEGPSGEAGKLGPRFSYDENAALVECVLDRWDELFGSQSHGITRVRRKHLWQEVADHVSRVGAYHREAATTYKRFSDVKRRVREKLLVRRKKIQMAGRESLKPINLKGYERRLLERIGQELCEGIEAEYLEADVRRSLRCYSPAFRDEPSVGGPAESCEQVEPQDGDGAEVQAPLEPYDEQVGTFMDEPVRAFNVQQPEYAAAERAEHCPGRGLGEPAAPRVPPGVPPGVPGVFESLHGFFQTIMTRQRRQEVHFRRWMARVDGHLNSICTAMQNLGDGLQTIAAELREARLEHHTSSKTFNNALLAILGQVIAHPLAEGNGATGHIDRAGPGPSSAAPPPPSRDDQPRRGRGAHRVRGYKRKRQ
ncbi:hypothetical protein XENTR_v10015572 [Xenopus tropicalis]|nr:hypothetical protein XENTR_v10015572 [Xenopus tropicalis]